MSIITDEIERDARSESAKLFQNDDVANARLGRSAFFSMVDGRKKLHREIVAQLPAERAEVVLVGIPAASEVELMGVHRQAVVWTAPRSRAARAYRELWEEIRARVDLSWDLVGEHPSAHRR